MTYKIVNDAVYGAIRIEGPILDLMETLELQRLNAIRQLGLTYLTFPGANHSRIEHSLGVYHIANRIAKHLNLDEHERNLVCCAALLHDIGHGPFSHTLEPIMNDILKEDHMEFTEKIIMGKEDNVLEDERKEFGEVKRIPEVLEAHKISLREVAELIRGGGKKYLGQIVHGTIDADQLDYLMRDALYTGVAHGIIDIDRIIETLSVHENSLVIDKKGVAAVEGLLVARALMYSSVYFHKTVRIAEMMMARAVASSKGNISNVRKMVDAELMNWLVEQGGYQRSMALKIKYRKLFKKAYELDEDDLKPDKKNKIIEYSKSQKRQDLEMELCRAAKVPEGTVIVDIPMIELALSEPRLKKTDLKIFDGTKVSNLESLSPLGKALRTRKTSDWFLMVSADQKYGNEVKRVAEKVINEIVFH
jgi:HD superfamily phosphohydrolase